MEKKDYSQEEMECGMCESACGQCGMQSECGGCGGCGMGCRQMHGMQCGGRHYLLRWVLGILIIVFVFVAGIKIGEFKERVLGGGYGYRTMERGYDKMPGYGMMQWQNGSDIDALYRYGMMRGAEAPKQIAPTE